MNVEHGCHYCVPAHTGIAKSMKVRDDLIEELRNDDTLSDAKLNTLKETVLAVTRNRGNIDSAQLDAFYSAGYKHQQLLEIILILAQKVMSNYTNHIAETPVDEPFKKFEWIFFFLNGPNHPKGLNGKFPIQIVWMDSFF